MKRAFTWLGVLSLVLVVALAWGIGTQTGSRFVLERTESTVPALSFDGASGTLWSGLQMSRVDFQQDGIDITATDMTWRWRLGCLLERRLCIDSLVIDDLSVTLPPSSGGAETAGPRELPDVELPVGLTLRKLDIARAHVALAGTEAEFTDARLALDARGSRVAVTELGAQWRVGELSGGLAVAGTLETVGAYPLALQARVHGVVGRVTDATLPSTDLELTLSDSLTSLDVDAHLSGIATAALEARLQPLDPSIPLDAELSISNARWPWVGEEATEIAGASLSAQGSIERFDMALKGTVHTSQVDSVEVEWSGDVVANRGIDESRFSVAALEGTLSGDLSVGWQDAVSVDLEATVEGLNPDHLVPDLTGRISGRMSASLRVDPSDTSGFAVDRFLLDLAGHVREQPVSLIGEASLRDSTVRINAPGFNLAFGDNHAMVVGTVGDVFALSSALYFRDLSQILPSLRGEAQGEVAVSGARDRPSVSAVASAASVRTGGIAVQQLQLDGELIGGGTAPSELTLDWGGLVIGEQTVDSGAVTLSGDRGAHRATVDVDSDLVQLKWQIEGQLDDGGWRGRLLDSWLAVAEHRWRNTGPVGVSVAKGSARVDAHCWQSAPAQVCLDAPANLAASGSASLRVAELPVEWLTVALPEAVPLTGVLDGNLDAAWTPDAMPIMRSNLDARRLVAVLPAPSGEQVPVALGDLALTLAPADGTPSQALIRATLDSSGGALGQARINVLVQPDQPLLYRGDVRWRDLQLAVLQPLWPALDSLGGELSIDTRVQGERNGPVFDGTAQLRNGELRGLDLPTEVFGAWLDVTLSGKQAGLNGGWRAEGNADSDAVTLDGAIDWLAEPSLDLRVFGQDVPIDYRPWVKASVGPDLTVTASAERVAVRGRVEIPQAEIDIVAPESQPPTPSADTVLLDEASPVAGGENAGVALDVDVDVIIRDEVYLSGYGFDSRLQGAIDVRLAPKQPLQLFGDLSILDGRYQAWGQNLAVERGEIVFSGPPETAVVDAIAWRELEAVRAGVSVEGQVTSPEVRVISEPTLSDQEALSYLVLGRAWGEAGDQQAAIARAALSLGLKRSGGLTSRVADGLGLQSLSVEAQGSGDDTSAVINAQLNNKLSVQYGVGVFVPFRTLTARYQLSKQLYVEAVQGVESALDFFYSFEF